MALLDELGRDALPRDLVGGRDVVEIGVLGERIQPVVVHRPVGVAEDRFRVSAVVELAERAVADGMIELADHAPVRRHLEPHAVPQQPGGPFRESGVRLFRLVDAVFDGARELDVLEAVPDAHATGDAVGLRAGQRVDQRAHVGIRAEVPALVRGQIDAGRVRQPGGRAAVLVALLEVNARAVGRPPFHAKHEVAAPRQEPAVHALVLERVVQVEVGALGIEEAAADAAARSEVSLRDFGVDAQALGEAIGAADADPAVVLAVARGRDGILDEAVAAPGRSRVVGELEDRVGALALLLRQRHDRRVVGPLVVADSRAQLHVRVQFESGIHLDRGRLQSRVDRPPVALDADVEALRHRHPEGPADDLRVRHGREPRRRVAGVERLRVERHAPVAAVEEIAEAHADVGPVRAGIGPGK